MHLPPLWDGLTDALLGYLDPKNGRPIAVYSYDKALRIFMDMGMSYQDAVEYMEFNVVGAYIGEQTPMWVYPAEEINFWDDEEDFLHSNE